MPNKTPKELPAEVQAKLDAYVASKGLRRTRQRDVIVRTAFGSNDHFTADELWEKCRKFDQKASRATVYRTLNLLEECGLLRTIDLGMDQKVYDPNFIDHPHHNHLICLDCHKVVEFEDKHISLLEDCITRRLGFHVASKSIRIEANCDELQKHGVCKSRKH
jgi:Fur family ferric uptake transcriptional regulator